MVKKKHITILLFLLAAVFTLSIGNSAIASGPLSNACTFVDANGNSSGISLSILPDSDGHWPWALASGEYKWVYQVTGTVSGANQVTALETVCSPLPELGYTTEGGGQVYDPGAGDPTGYGTNDWQVYAVRMAYASTSTGIPAYSFLTSKMGSVNRNTSMQLKMGKYMYYCRNIIGPGCYKPRIAATATKKIQLNPDVPDQYIIVTFRADGSVESVVDNTGAVLEWKDLSTLGDLNGLPVTYVPDDTVIKSGDHSCYYYVYYGRYCAACY